MAEAFANHYGGDVMIATSAGLAPIESIPEETVAVMREMNIDVSGHVPHRYDPFEALSFDLIINMAGFRLPGPTPQETREWAVPDPYRSPLAAYRLIRDELEHRVMRLILDLRRRARMPA